MSNQLVQGASARQQRNARASGYDQGMKQPPAEQKETDYQAVREALSTVVASSEYTGERDMCTHSLAVLDRMEAERDQLRIDLAEVLEALRDELDCPDSATLRRAAAVLLKHDRRASGER